MVFHVISKHFTATLHILVTSQLFKSNSINGSLIVERPDFTTDLLNPPIVPQGAKNEALQVICAVLLTPEEVIIENIPEIRDVLKLIELLKNLGVKVNRIEKGKFSFQADAVDIDFLDSPEFKAQALHLEVQL